MQYNINLLLCRTISGETPLIIAYDRDVDVFEAVRNYLSRASVILKKVPGYVETLCWKDLPEITEQVTCKGVYTCDFGFEVVKALDLQSLNGKVVFGNQTVNANDTIIKPRRRSGWVLIRYGKDYKGLHITVESPRLDELACISAVAQGQGIKTWGDLPQMPRSVCGVTTSILTDLMYVEGTIFGCFNAEDPIGQ